MANCNKINWGILRLLVWVNKIDVCTKKKVYLHKRAILPVLDKSMSISNQYKFLLALQLRWLKMPVLFLRLTCLWRQCFAFEVNRCLLTRVYNSKEISILVPWYLDSHKRLKVAWAPLCTYLLIQQKHWELFWVSFWYIIKTKRYLVQNATSGTSVFSTPALVVPEQGPWPQ